MQDGSGSWSPAQPHDALEGTCSHPECSLPPHLMSPPWLSQGDRHHTTTPMARHNPTHTVQQRVHNTRIHLPVHLLHEQRRSLLFPHMGPLTLRCPRCKPPCYRVAQMLKFCTGLGENRTNPREEKHNEGFSVIILACLQKCTFLTMPDVDELLPF